MPHYPAEPWRIKVVEPIKSTTREFREAAIRQAGWNTCLLRSEDVYIDLFTDSGTNAMSDRQWSRMMVADEAYCQPTSFYVLEAAVRKYYGFEHVIPVHQGRGGENLVSRMLIRPGHHIPGNMYFPSTRAHQELNGATFHDVIIDEANNSRSQHPFKGNVDLDKLEAVVTEYGVDNIPYFAIGATVNMAGGQPISLDNLTKVRAVADKYGIKIMLDVCRAVENAWFIKQREPGQEDKPVAEILLAMCSLADGAVMSAKKDSMTNIGGWIGFRDDELAQEARSLVVLFEGLQSYGGMSGRDLEAVAQGIAESVQDDNISARIGQVEYLGQRLLDAGVPIVEPIGGHGIYVDALAVLPHIPREEFPAATLVAACYIDAGVRGVERGVISTGRDPVTGENRFPELELVRFAIPRRVYTKNHMDLVADSLIRVYEEREQIVCGLKFEYEPRHLRFFQARFAPTAGESIFKP